MLAPMLLTGSAQTATVALVAHQEDCMDDEKLKAIVVREHGSIMILIY